MLGMYAAFVKGQAPANLQPFFDVPNQVSTAELTANLSGTGPTSLVAHANDEAAAQAVMTLINEANQKYQSDLKAQLAEQLASEDPVERAFAQYAERISGTWMGPMLPAVEGSKLTLFHTRRPRRIAKEDCRGRPWHRRRHAPPRNDGRPRSGSTRQFPEPFEANRARVSQLSRHQRASLRTQSTASRVHRSSVRACSYCRLSKADSSSISSSNSTSHGIASTTRRSSRRCPKCTRRPA